VRTRSQGPSVRGDRWGTAADLVILGLGNPGAELAGTRHNVGADAVELLAQRHGARLRPLRGVRVRTTDARIGGHPVLLAVPTTYMNDSGSVVRAVLHRAGVEGPERLLVVHDELDLPPGTVRLKRGGGIAGHHGLRSVRDHLHSADFLRARIGIGKPNNPRKGADHVLRRPGAQEGAVLAAAVEVAADAAELVVEAGMDRAMNACNATRPGTE